jgi:hypothetical protein
MRTNTPPDEYEVKLEKGDRIRIATGEELMVIAVTTSGWLFKSLNGRGKPMLTSEELVALEAEGV